MKEKNDFQVFAEFITETKKKMLALFFFSRVYQKINTSVVIFPPKESFVCLFSRLKWRSVGNHLPSPHRYCNTQTPQKRAHQIPRADVKITRPLALRHQTCEGCYWRFFHFYLLEVFFLSVLKAPPLLLHASCHRRSFINSLACGGAACTRPLAESPRAVRLPPAE